MKKKILFSFWEIVQRNISFLVNRAYGLNCSSVIAATLPIIYIIHPWKNSIYGTITPGDRTQDAPAFTSRYGLPHLACV